MDKRLGHPSSASPSFPVSKRALLTLAIPFRLKLCRNMVGVLRSIVGCCRQRLGWVEEVKGLG
jgi:hypothetical protein